MFRRHHKAIPGALALVIGVYAMQLPGFCAPAAKKAAPAAQGLSSEGENLMYYTPPPLQYDTSGKPIPNMPNLVYQANAYFEAGQKAFFKNDMEFAESYLKKSIECRDKLNKVREAKEYVKGVNLLGKVLRKKNKFDEAEKYYRQALTMATQGLGVDAYEVKECQLNLAECYEKTNKYQDAVSYYKTLLATSEKKYGADDPDVQEYANKILSLSIKGGNYATAETMLKQKIDFEESQGHGNSEKSAKLMEQYADVLKKQLKMDEAAAVEEKLKSIKEASAK